MKIEILTIGDEILSGTILDTNKSYLSEECWQRGFPVEYHTGVRDAETPIRDAIKLAQTRADAVLVTGGLGPTADDFTIEIAARAFGVETVFDEASLKHLEALYAKRGRTVSQNNRKQALIPKGGRALFNSIGTAPGVYYLFGNTHFYFMPGVPVEMKKIFQNEVLPHLLAQRKDKVFFENKNLRTFGCAESELDNKLKDLYQDRLNIKNVRIGFRVSFPDIFVKLSVWENTQEQAKKNLEEVAKLVRERIGEFIYSEEEKTLEQVVVERLTQKGITVAVAESCTGGLVAHRLTNVSGSSAVFLGGVVSYANDMKSKVLGVSEEILKTHGAVSSECAEEMVLGVQHLTGAKLCAAVTGIAGPTGGTSEKPVGTVHIATWFEGRFENKKYLLPFPREMFKSLVASLVLQRFLKVGLL